MTNLDIAVVILYLSITVVLGYIFGRNIATIREYAIGSRSFPYAILVATLIATWIDSELMFYTAAHGFDLGIFALVIASGCLINLFVVRALIFRIHRKFRDTISVGEIMGRLYGNGARVITGISSTLLSTAFVATQFKAITMVLHYFVNIPVEFGVWIPTIITISYACFGGIRAVTFTDLFQFYIIIGFIPIMFGYTLQHFGALPGLIDVIPASKLFFDLEKNINIPNIFLFLSYSVPLLSPPIIQRILMAKDIRQAKKTFFISTIILALFMIITVFIGLMSFVIDPHMDPNNAFLYIIDNYMTPGLKGFAVAGVLAVIMSSSDSFMNTGAVAFSHDFLQPLCDYNISDRTQIIITRLATFWIGIFATLTAIIFDTILELMLYSYNLWGPIITVPLISGILGYKQHKLSFYIGVSVGISISLIWRLFAIENIMHFDGLMPAILGNLISFTLANIFINKKSYVAKVTINS